MNRILKKTEYKLSDINQAVHVSIYCMSVQKNIVYLKRNVKKKKKSEPKTNHKIPQMFPCQGKRIVKRTLEFEL